MLGNYFRLALAIGVSFLFTQNRVWAIDVDAVEKLLQGDGAVGWIHGSVDRWDQFVFTYREPNNFFEHLEFPLLAQNEEVREQLSKLHRHDKVKLKGSFLVNSAPIRHIRVEQLTVVEKFKSPEHELPYEYKAKLPGDLTGKQEMIAKVHAVVDNGKVLVLEYRDAVVPVFSKKPELAKALYRNDKIRVWYKLQEMPGRPAHVIVDTTREKPIEVLESIVQLHEKPAVVEGSLVMFPKSPQVIFNVFALHTEDADGIEREYTLLNFDPEVFTKIREKLQKFWDEGPKTPINGRNKLIKPIVKVRAKGTFNVVDAGQANPQILLENAEALTLLP